MWSKIFQSAACLHFQITVHSFYALPTALYDFYAETDFDISIFDKRFKTYMHQKIFFMNDFINIQDASGATHVIFTKHITNLTIQNSTAKIHINSGGSPMTVHTKFTIKELMDIIVNKPQ